MLKVTFAVQLARLARPVYISSCLALLSMFEEIVLKSVYVFACMAGKDIRTARREAPLAGASDSTDWCLGPCLRMGMSSTLVFLCAYGLWLTGPDYVPVCAAGCGAALISNVCQGRGMQ